MCTQPRMSDWQNVNRQYPATNLLLNKPNQQQQQEFLKSLINHFGISQFTEHFLCLFT
jgi:hypothetical protein